MIAAFVLAATLNTTPESPKDFKRWQFYGALNAGDLITSEYAWHYGAKEGNPLMVHGRLQAYGVKLALTVVVVESDRYLSHRCASWVRWTFRSLVGSWYAFWMSKALYHGSHSH